MTDKQINTFQAGFDIVVTQFENNTSRKYVSERERERKNKVKR